MAKHNIAEAAKVMGFTPAYVRSLIRKGQLVSGLEPIVPESLVKRHVITDEDIKLFLSQSKRQTHRADGRNKYVVYMTRTEYEAVKIVLTENGLAGVVETMRTWNPVKGVIGTAPVKVAKPKKRVHNVHEA